MSLKKILDDEGQEVELYALREDLDRNRTIKVSSYFKNSTKLNSLIEILDAIIDMVPTADGEYDIFIKEDAIRKLGER